MPNGEGYISSIEGYEVKTQQNLYTRSIPSRNASIMRNPNGRRYALYYNATPSYNGHYIGEAYSEQNDAPFKIAYVDSVGGIEGYTHNDGYKVLSEGATVVNMGMAMRNVSSQVHNPDNLMLGNLLLPNYYTVYDNYYLANAEYYRSALQGRLENYSRIILTGDTENVSQYNTETNINIQNAAKKAGSILRENGITPEYYSVTDTENETEDEKAENKNVENSIYINAERGEDGRFTNESIQREFNDSEVRPYGFDSSSNVETYYLYSENNSKGTTEQRSDLDSLNSLDSVEYITEKDIKQNKGLLNRTNSLFRNGKIGSIINRFHTEDKESDQLQTGDATYGMSRGRNLLVKGAKDRNNVADINSYDNPYCRVWTSHYQYAKLQNRIRPFYNGDTAMPIGQVQEGYTLMRPFSGETRLQNMSSLGTNGYPIIVPHTDASGGTTDISTDIRRCMFSIENLAWKDINRDAYIKGVGKNTIGKVLSEEQKGPLGGRIMWFPPYNLKFTENVSVQWQENSFIGRGEKVYTYANTERKGTLNFTLLIDHPSAVDLWDGLKDGDLLKERSDDLLRFFAGCARLEINNIGSTGTTWIKTTAVKDIEVPSLSEPVPEKKVGYEKRFYVFFPNNLSGCDFKDNPQSVAEYLMGYETDRGPLELCMEETPIVGKYGNWYYQVDNATVNQRLTGGTDNYHDTVSFRLNDNLIRIIDLDEDISEDYPNDESGPGLNEQVPSNEDRKRLVNLFDLYDMADTDTIINFSSVVENQLNDVITPETLLDYDITVEVNGFASSHGPNVNRSTGNTRLSTQRAVFVQNLLKSYRVIEEENISMGSIKTLSVSDNDVNGFEAKMARCAEAVITFTPKENAKPTKSGKASVSQYENYKSYNNGNMLMAAEITETEYVTHDEAMTSDEEYRYFKRINDNDPMIRKYLVQKVQYFDPAFHSITPEGFNSRLTFLHQCTRQGPTYSAGDMKTGSMGAGNLAFGRPPICVLRIGDFYNTKIFIDSLNIDYDNNGGIQWDLNPEGIGIQPMMANVTINFTFIGGSDLSGPISRLQNAVSENYYANTSVYSRRADYRDTFATQEDMSYNAWNATFESQEGSSNSNALTEHKKFGGN